MGDIAFEVKNLTMKFPGTTALDHVSLQLMEKEIHAIVGENGAGKSTLCKIMTGNYQATEGEMFLKGQKVNFRSPADSLAVGVCMLYQERNMIPTFTGIQNICLGGEPRKGFFLDEAAARKKAYELQERLGVNLPLDCPIGELGAGTQQMIEILRAFYHNPIFMILDEPTASLGEGEVEPFLEFVKHARDDLGLPVIYITHKLEEVFKIADHVTVLTDGKISLSRRIEDTQMREVVSAMLRQHEIAPIEINQTDVSSDEPILSVGNCTYDGYEHKLGFDLRSGEVVGFYGLVGSGRTECSEMLFGIKPAEKVDIRYRGEHLKAGSINPAAMIEKGLVMTPETRSHGVFYQQTIENNINVLFLNKKYLIKPFGLVKTSPLRKLAEIIVEKHNVKLSSLSQNIGELSGGNMQKVIIGRSIETENNSVMIFDEPTNGIDIGAKYEIYRKVRHLAEDEKKAILFISSEIEELFVVCDRIYVFASGDIVGEFPRDKFDKMTILQLALGGK